MSQQVKIIWQMLDRLWQSKDDTIVATFERSKLEIGKYVMDFIVGLPITQKRMYGDMVIIGRLNKFAYLFPGKDTYIVYNWTQLYMRIFFD